MNIFCTSKQLDSLLRSHIRFDIEEVWAIALSSNLSLLGTEMIFRGHASGCFIHAREIFRFAIKHNAVHLVIAHSHPSGDHQPSNADLKITRELYEIGRWLKIPLIDHLILSQNGFLSMSDQGHFATWSKRKRSFY